MPVARKYEGGAAIGPRQRIAAAATRCDGYRVALRSSSRSLWRCSSSTGAQGGADRAAQTEVTLQVLAGPDRGRERSDRPVCLSHTRQAMESQLVLRGSCLAPLGLDAPTTGSDSIARHDPSDVPLLRLDGRRVFGQRERLRSLLFQMTNPVVSVFPLYDPARILVRRGRARARVKWARTRREASKSASPEPEPMHDRRPSRSRAHRV